MAKEKKRRRGGFLLLIVLVLIALAVLLLIGGPGLFGGEGTGIFGDGKTTETGSGDGTGTGDGTTTTMGGEVTSSTSETTEKTETTEYVAPNDISIKNDKIYYGTEEVDVATLRSRLITDYKDGTVYMVSHDNVSLLKTYDDVIAVLDDLQSTIGLQ